MRTTRLRTRSAAIACLPNGELARYAVAWMKRFLDNDTRYSSFACQGGGPGYTFRSTCPA